MLALNKLQLLVLYLVPFVQKYFILVLLVVLPLLQFRLQFVYHRLTPVQLFLTFLVVVDTLLSLVRYFTLPLQRSNQVGFFLFGRGY